MNEIQHLPCNFSSQNVSSFGRKKKRKIRAQFMTATLSREWSHRMCMQCSVFRLNVSCVWQIGANRFSIDPTFECAWNVTVIVPKYKSAYSIIKFNWNLCWNNKRRKTAFPIFELINMFLCCCQLWSRNEQHWAVAKSGRADGLHFYQHRYQPHSFSCSAFPLICIK